MIKTRKRKLTNVPRKSNPGVYFIMNQIKKRLLTMTIIVDSRFLFEFSIFA
ncbi:hypothetical protein JCM14108_609 [Lentilactobacillus farraginis DSM 18382 = JCM 14108]|uniref:Uncharacterized protein n=1 Tax=Lentilactobacillus farraginis DSM 18382 = JCM 14108 TaxID=1423743 RepID=X0QAS0_9LACO|nr:hypothetical protein JCM14108_609 [Lentilactobacillus farraginis DSM 18382 = JCM 14108]